MALLWKGRKSELKKIFIMFTCNMEMNNFLLLVILICYYGNT